MSKMGQTPSGTIRPFRESDIPDICRLFTRTFRAGGNIRQDELAAAIAATYLGGPAYRSESGSVVHVDAQGCVDGFMGVINMTLRLGERTLRAGVLSAYMADRPDANPMIGVSLVRSVLQHPLDVIFSDTANRTSLDMSRALRFSVLPLQSLEWTKILRPVGTLAYLLCRKHRPLLRWLARPAAAVDAILPRRSAIDFNERKLVGATDRAVTMTEFVAAAPSFLDGYVLRPAWDEAELSWLTKQATRQTKNGPLHVREVLDRNRRRAGIYLLYACQGGVASALQILARNGLEEVVVGSMIRTARELGAVAVRGAASREAMLGILRHNAVLYRHVMSTVVWTQDPEISASLRSGNVFLGGLAGETWASIFSDAFQ